MSPIALEQENHTRDAEFNKAMHGKSAGTRGGMSAMLQKDKAAQQAAVDEYFKHWDNKAAGDETEETRKVREPPNGAVPADDDRRGATSTRHSPGTTTTWRRTCTSTVGARAFTFADMPMASRSTRPLRATSTTSRTR